MDRNVVLSGNLHFLGIPDLLQLLATNSSTGILRLTNSNGWGGPPASVTFLKGNPIHAVHGSESGLEALYALFGWSEGHFEFIRKKVDEERTIRGNQMEIVLEGLRMLDEGLIKRLGADWDEEDHPNRTVNPSKIPLIKKPMRHYVFVAAEEEFSKGTTILEEGEFGNWIWMVLHGTAEMTKKTNSGPTRILRVGQGGFIGNISSMMTSDRRRIGTFTATETVRLGVLDPEPIYAEYSSLSHSFKSVLLSLDNRLRELLERLSEIYPGTGDMKKAAFNPKKQTGKGKLFEAPFLISKGNVTIVKEMRGKTFPLVNLHSKDFFGPLPFLEMGHEPFNASVVFSDDLESVALDPDELQSEYDQLGHILKGLVDFSVNCISIATMKILRHYTVGK